MAALITIEELREHVETDATDGVLDLVLADADDAIVRRTGPHAADGEVTERITASGPFIFLKQRAAEVSAVKEFNGSLNGTQIETDMEPEDYRLWFNGGALMRLVTGPHAGEIWAWPGYVEVTYTPIPDAARRARITVDLCKLALSFKGLIKSERAGDYQSSGVMSASAYQEERQRLISELLPIGGVAFA